LPALDLPDAATYLRRLQGPGGDEELRSLLPLVTVGHTEFFRDLRQFQALERQILPDLLARARREGRKLRAWSAGCATGEEAYSLAMVLLELGATPAEADVWATDLNSAAVESARRGVFPERRLAALSDERRRRFFVSTAQAGQATDALKALVRFEPLNLAAPTLGSLPPASLDVVLCRNVIIYFDLDTIRALMGRLWQALRPGGFLLLGYSESLFRVFDAFQMVEVQEAFVYRRPEAQGPVPVRAGRSPSAVVPPAPSSAPVPGPVPDAPVSPRPSPVRRLDALVSQMRQGDFDAALATAQAIAPADADLATLLTVGNLYALLGQPERAQGAFEEVLTREPFCVEARVYAGIAALGQGELPRARGELSKALFLEPTLAVGYFLLAQVEEKAGEREDARRAYRNALAQLRFRQRPLAGYYPDLPDASDVIARASRYALAALGEA